MRGGTVAGAVKAPEIHTRHVVKMTRRGTRMIGSGDFGLIGVIEGYYARVEVQCGDDGSLVTPLAASTAAPNF